jgi:hypothetical protein
VIVVYLQTRWEADETSSKDKLWVFDRERTLLREEHLVVYSAVSFVTGPKTYSCNVDTSFYMDLMTFKN